MGAAIYQWHMHYRGTPFAGHACRTCQIARTVRANHKQKDSEDGELQEGTTARTSRAVGGRAWLSAEGTVGFVISP